MEFQILKFAVVFVLILGVFVVVVAVQSAPRASAIATALGRRLQPHVTPLIERARGEIQSLKQEADAIEDERRREREGQPRPPM